MTISAPRMQICRTAIAFVLATCPAISLRAQDDSKDVTDKLRNQTDVNLPSLSPLVRRVMPAVVNISVEMGAQDAAPIADDVPGAGDGGDDQGGDSRRLDELLRRYFGQRGLSVRDGIRSDGIQSGGGQSGPDQLTALGSGFIIDPSGYVVTNDHVIARSERTTVVFQDNSRHAARLVGRDEKTDLALLKIDTAQPLPFLHWGDSDVADVGDWVVAVGNPFGLGGTVTAGIVSARGRDIGSGPYDRFLQIDAPINRGNSGGPTFNLRGEVIGINTAIYSPSGGSIGIGFAIPANFAHSIVDQLKTAGHVERGWLGVSIQPLTAAIAQAFGADPANPSGALVDDVQSGSPAAAAGIRQGDVILAVDGQPVQTAEDLPRLIGMSKIGHKLHVTVQRNGRRDELVATLAPQPSPALVANADGDGATGAAPVPRVGPFGIALRPLTPDLRKQLRPGQSIKGVVVSDLVPGSPAARLGLQPGDIIESVNRVAIETPDAAEARLRDAVAGGAVVLFVDRDGAGQFVGMSAQTP
jgi:serine protease Do